MPKMSLGKWIDWLKAQWERIAFLALVLSVLGGASLVGYRDYQTFRKIDTFIGELKDNEERLQAHIDSLKTLSSNAISTATQHVACYSALLLHSRDIEFHSPVLTKISEQFGREFEDIVPKTWKIKEALEKMDSTSPEYQVIDGEFTSLESRKTLVGNISDDAKTINSQLMIRKELIDAAIIAYERDGDRSETEICGVLSQHRGLKVTLSDGSKMNLAEAMRRF